MYIHKRVSLNGGNPHGNSFLGNKIRKLYNDGGEILYTKIEENVNASRAAELEILKIREIGRHDLGRGPLCNLTDGGDGIVNLTAEQIEKKLINAKVGFANMSLEDRTRRIENIKNWYRNEPADHRQNRLEKLRTASIGKPKSAMHKSQLSKAMKGRKPWNKGKTMTAEVVDRFRKSHKSSENVKRCIQKLHERNKLLGTNVGKNNPSYKHYDDSTIQRIVDLYQSGWGAKRISKHLKTEGVTISPDVIYARLKSGGVTLRKSLTIFNTPASLDQSLTT